MAYLGLGFLFLVVFTLLTALSRAHELYCLSVRRGRSLVVRGLLPASAQAEVDALFRGSDSTWVVVRAFEREGDLHLGVTGASAEEERRLRVLLGGLRGQDIPPLPRNRNWWNVVGFVWLAWWMEGRNRDEPPEDPPEPPRAPPSNITPFRR